MAGFSIPKGFGDAVIKEYVTSKEGKKRIEEEIDASLILANDEALEYAERMKEILFDHLSKTIRSFRKGENEDDIVVVPHYNDKGIIDEVSIEFNISSLHRESLYPQGYKDGLRNIVLLFAKGYDAKAGFYGKWVYNKGGVDWTAGRVPTKTLRHPDPFLENAVKKFNAEAPKGVRAVLDEKYVT